MDGAERKKQWRRDNIEKCRKAERAYRKRNPDKGRNANLMRLYGITAEQFDSILSTQGGRCANCRTDAPGARNWHVDHDHMSGMIRGILCKPCNTAIGTLGDNIAGLERALAYLKKSGSS
jgi:Recombination endonuclease VII